MATPYGRKSCRLCQRQGVKQACMWATHEEALGLGVHIQEDEREADGKANPEDDEPDDEPHECGHGREVAERLRAQEPRERVLLHCAEAVLLLRVEHVRDLRHYAYIVRGLRLVVAVQRERVDAQCRRKVDLVVLGRADRTCGREVAEVDALCGRNEVLARDGGGARDDRRRARRATHVEKRRRAPGEREGRR